MNWYEKTAKKKKKHKSCHSCGGWIGHWMSSCPGCGITHVDSPSPDSGDSDDSGGSGSDSGGDSGGGDAGGSVTASKWRLAQHQEPNWAEREVQIYGPTATDQQCYGLGKTHKAYQWGRKYGDWTDRQKAIYDHGYEGKPMPSFPPDETRSGRPSWQRAQYPPPPAAPAPAAAAPAPPNV